MTKQFKVLERQTVVVSYLVEADDEDQARELVRGLGFEEYDNVEDYEDCKIIEVTEMKRKAKS